MSKKTKQPKTDPNPQPTQPANAPSGPVLVELLGEVEHDGKTYPAGATLELAHDAASSLFTVGAARLAEDAASEPAPNDDDDAGDPDPNDDAGDDAST